VSQKNIREIKITNTLTGKKEVLETLDPGKLSLYSCGPTVYNLIHIGNLRSALVSDLFFRYFKKVGYEVSYARNYTDVDDKIINKAIEEKISSDEVAKRYTQEVEKDYLVSGVQEPTIKPKATDHMSEMISMIEQMVEKGFAYVVEGEAIFSIDKFDDYGKLSHQNIEDLIAGMRVDVNDKKKNPFDFTLWKPAKPGEPSWDSPWGPGRPGWHIECSAMISKCLGDKIDIHHGGEDLIFPHHENEIAQSEAALGKKPFVKYWMHHAFLTLSKEKMSKSVGNVFSAREFLTQYSGEVARYLLLSVHYRSMIDFSDETIENTLNALQRIYEAKEKALKFTQVKTLQSDKIAESFWGEFVAKCDQAHQEIDDFFANDFNSAGALSVLFTLIRDYNHAMMQGKASQTPSVVLASQALLNIMEKDIGDILGVAQLDPRKMLTDLERIRLSRLQASGVDQVSSEDIEQKIKDRLEARKQKDFSLADQIRDDLLQKGVVIKDSPTGTTWSFK